MNTYRPASGGYTIMEVMIVLVISSVLFVTSITAYTQQNRRTQFTESVNSFSQNLQDILNDVETGFYPSRGDFRCTVSAAGPNPNLSGSNQQGTNEACTFLGKAIQFAPPPAARSSEMDIYTIVGRRMSTATPPKVVTNIDQAQPRAINTVADTKFLTADVEIYAVKNKTTNQEYAGIAIVSSTESGSASGLNTRANLASVGSTLGMANFTAAIAGINSTSLEQAKGGINICLREKGDGDNNTGREAILEIITDRSQIVLNVKIDQKCP